MESKRHFEAKRKRKDKVVSGSASNRALPPKMRQMRSTTTSTIVFNDGRTVARQGRRWRWRKKNVDGDEKEDDERGVLERKKE